MFGRSVPTRTVMKVDQKLVLTKLLMTMRCERQLEITHGNPVSFTYFIYTLLLFRELSVGSWQLVLPD